MAAGFIVRFAAKGVLQNRRRSILTIGAIAFSTFVLSFFICLQLSSYAASQESATGLWMGSGQFMLPEQRDTNDFESRIWNPKELLAALGSLKPPVSSTRRAFSPVLFSSSTRSIGAMLVGVDPSTEPLVSRIHKNMVLGSYPSADAPQGVTLGEQLARRTQVSLGDELTLIGQAADGSVAASVLTVTGIFRTGAREFDQNFALIPLAEFQEIFQLGESVHRIVIYSQGDDDRRIRSAIQNINSATQYYSWTDLMPEVREAQELDFVASWFFYAGLLIVVALTIMSTLLMSIIDRMSDFGLMRALGLLPRQLVLFVLAETSLLLTIGLSIGTFCAWLTVSYFGVHGFSIPGTQAISKEFNIPSRIYTEWSTLGMLAPPAVLILLTSLATIAPLLYVLSVKPLAGMEDSPA